jgi:hypothetical protein
MGQETMIQFLAGWEYVSSPEHQLSWHHFCLQHVVSNRKHNQTQQIYSQILNTNHVIVTLYMTITAYLKEYKNTVIQKNLMFKFVAFYNFNILLLLINLHDPSNAGLKLCSNSSSTI